MTFASFKNARIVRSGWLEESGRRLDCNPYMSGALEARDTLKNLSVRKDPLGFLTDGYGGGIYNGPMFIRRYVTSEASGVPFITSGNMMRSDLSDVPLLRKADAESNKLRYLRVRPGTTLISCSGTIGRMAYVRPDMGHMWSSQDVLKVVPNEDVVSPGYLHAFLSSKYGVPLVISGAYGAIIQHIEPEHIRELPVPRFDLAFEVGVHNKVDAAANKLARYQRLLREATEHLFSAVGLKDISPAEWHSSGPDVGFSNPAITSASLRALNFNPRYENLVRKIKSSPFKTLDEICLPGTLSRGGRFKRVDAEPAHAYQMIGQKELFWLKPEGRWIAKSAMDEHALGIPGAVMVAAQGTLGESELYCRSEFVWGPWTEMAFSEHILRVIADESVMPRGCLFAFMRSETAFRMLRSISVGSKLQDHHYQYRGELPVPYPEQAVQQEIHAKIVSAYENRHAAVSMIDEAVQMVEQRIASGE